MLELPILAIYVTCIAGMITAATRKRDERPPWERENGKEEIGKWLTGFLAKLKRNSTRTEKCRLISSGDPRLGLRGLGLRKLGLREYFLY